LSLSLELQPPGGHFGHSPRARAASLLTTVVPGTVSLIQVLVDDTYSTVDAPRLKRKRIWLVRRSYPSDNTTYCTYRPRDNSKTDADDRRKTVVRWYRYLLPATSTGTCYLLPYLLMLPYFIDEQSSSAYLDRRGCNVN
jgi:hypothetical protein